MKTYASNLLQKSDLISKSILANISLIAVNIFLLFFPYYLCTIEDEKSCVHRIQSHLILKDSDSAIEELQKGLLKFPHSEKLLASKIRIHACREQEREMLSAWKQLQQMQPGISEKENLLEAMAWAVIRKGAKSPSAVTRAVSMMAAYVNQSTPGVSILHRGLSDSSSLVRSVAVELSGKMRDETLRQDILNLIRQEKITSVRLAAIKAAGQMKISDAYDELKETLERKQLSHEETAITIDCLVNTYEKADRDHVLALLQSPRGALRLLGCEVIFRFSLHRDLEELKNLIQDPQPDIRKVAFQILGQFDLPSYEALYLSQIGLIDPYPQVAISAAWLLTLYHPEKGMEALEPWLSHATREIRLYASGALIATGQYGVPLSIKLIDTHPDSFVRANLALHLIGQRSSLEKCCAILSQFLASEHGRIMWNRKGIFRPVEPSNLLHSGRNDKNPEISDQLARLELFEVLAIMQCPDVQESVKKFLKERTFGITGVAASLLLQEGDEEAIETVRSLLDDPDPKIRIQAALLLAMWGRDESAIAEFANVYHHADRNMKEIILEGLGNIGAPSTLPFLINKLSEPHQTLRIIAASSILQSLYH